MDLKFETYLRFGAWALGFLMAPLLLPFAPPMHSTFTQKVIICAVLGFLAACLIQWGKVFVQGADDALNKGYKHTSPAVTLTAKP